MKSTPFASAWDGVVTSLFSEVFCPEFSDTWACPPNGSLLPRELGDLLPGVLGHLGLSPDGLLESNATAESPGSSVGSTVDPGGEGLVSIGLGAPLAPGSVFPTSASTGSACVSMRSMLFVRFFRRFWPHRLKTIQSMQPGSVLIRRPILPLALSPSGLSIWERLFIMYS
eukprot:CAMPEP_0179186370 /NCGR_PEP_ID=MMETSP0796-20121207/92436_1 /TAXON_ID=73915 /ORGANISM="Pyrodinium bahamense, Strain pbaha01" /LENGTH=169 /DNA_ID=CAMNT_0020890361 /DNA_START=216 /DNA_END=726 /DNA_ORIENTATION=+